MDVDAIPMKIPQLEDVLAYTNSDIVYRFQKTYGVSREQSEDIFNQVKKWLWLSHQRRLAGLDANLFIDPPLVVIDEMWHNFVLFTKEYFGFCKQYFGYYIHHAPATEAEDREGREQIVAHRTIEERVNARKEQLRPQYEYIYDVLGKETLVKWYIEYPKDFSHQQLVERQALAVTQMLSEIRQLAIAA